MANPKPKPVKGTPPIPLSLRWKRRRWPTVAGDCYYARAGHVEVCVLPNRNVGTGRPWYWEVETIGAGTARSVLSAQRQAETCVRGALTRMAKSMKYTLVPHGGIAILMETK